MAQGRTRTLEAYRSHAKLQVTLGDRRKTAHCCQKSPCIGPEPYFQYPVRGNLGRSVLIQEYALGEVAERPKAAVLKTVDPKGSGGSNPSLSANLIFLIC